MPDLQHLIASRNKGKC